ncbi:MAG: hypothetical protein AB1483_00500 [Candidatus Zixiibacteriota bacterium]
MEELIRKPLTIKLSPVVQGLLYNRSESSLIEIVAEFADNLRESHGELLQKRNFATVSKLATELGYQVVGSPRQNVDFYVERPFFGSSFRLRGKRVTYLSNPITEEEARATIAHDIMHSLFETTDGQRPGNLPSDEIEEKLCDYGACRLLISKAELATVIAHGAGGNVASNIARVAGYFNIPRRYAAMRLFDPLCPLSNSGLTAIVEWRRKSGPTEEPHTSVVPTWSVCRKAFIPWLGSKRSCHARRESIVANAMSEDPYFRFSAVEDTNIGSLKGNYLVSVCVLGPKESPYRRVVSVFEDIG